MHYPERFTFPKFESPVGLNVGQIADFWQKEYRISAELGRLSDAQASHRRAREVGSTANNIEQAILAEFHPI